MLQGLWDEHVVLQEDPTKHNVPSAFLIKQYLMVYWEELVSDHAVNIRVHPCVTRAAALSEIKDRAVQERSGFAGKNQHCFVLPLVAVALMANMGLIWDSAGELPSSLAAPPTPLEINHTTSINNAYIHLWLLPLISWATLAHLPRSCLLEPSIFPFIALDGVLMQCLKRLRSSGKRKGLEALGHR